MRVPPLDELDGLIITTSPLANPSNSTYLPLSFIPFICKKPSKASDSKYYVSMHP